MFLQRGAEGYEAANVKRNAYVAGPKPTFGLKDTLVPPDTKVHDKIVGVPTSNFAEKYSHLLTSLSGRAKG